MSKLFFLHMHSKTEAKFSGRAPVRTLPHSIIKSLDRLLFSRIFPSKPILVLIFPISKFAVFELSDSAFTSTHTGL